MADLVTAGLTLACPWASWPAGRTAVLAWPAFTLIGLSTWAFGGFAAGTGPFFVLFFAWLGLHHEPKVILRCAPLAAVAYAVPLAVSGADARLVGTTVILMPIAVGVGLIISARVRALAQAQELLAFQATHDPLTDLPNRALAMRTLHAALSRAQRTGDLIAVMFIDLDGFKTVNDTHGHQAGDAVLRTVADRLRANSRAGDAAARLGGDEFVVVLEPVDREASAVAAAQRIIRAVSRPIPVGDSNEVRVGASVGLTFNLDAATDADAVLNEADQAAYRAKNSGRGRVVVFSSTEGDLAEPVRVPASTRERNATERGGGNDDRATRRPASTRVEPADLFDVGMQAPPVGTVEVYLPAPLSLSFANEAMASSSNPRGGAHLEQLTNLYVDAVDAAVRWLQREAGHVEVADGVTHPAQLSITRVAHTRIPGRNFSQLHAHLYVGPVGTSLEDGQTYPVNRSRLDGALESLYAEHRSTLERTTAALGFRWGPVPNHHPTHHEIIVPPFAEHLSDDLRADCPPVYTGVKRLYADAQARRLDVE
ncbi:GGDEF domain-containing protein [Antribacter sp. KLBMP9083]|uniref:GGDEF domain-containing protein n=1 Tax=Antribacter soli TaxID=2910976 RepID=A0AA41QI31_9MICO|nr:GGDEF domain-containing protein [Antribacter soli]MCF4123578.1 GGDEF domain-containing protein [Antribacter soli]